jgi:hypothetical protein
MVKNRETLQLITASLKGERFAKKIVGNKAKNYDSYEDKPKIIET